MNAKHLERGVLKHNKIGGFLYFAKRNEPGIKYTCHCSFQQVLCTVSFHCGAHDPYECKIIMGEVVSGRFHKHLLSHSFLHR